MRLLNQPLFIALVAATAARCIPLTTSHVDDAPPSLRDIEVFNLDPNGYQQSNPRGEYGDHLDAHPQRPKDPRGWVDPNENGGSMLDVVNNGLREPINAIISGKSDPYILTDRGLRDYVRSIGYSFECLDLHVGDLQRANLGDGAGWTEEMFEYRSTRGFGAPGRWVGACWESWNGGDHFRVWKQNGSEANTGAWFLAISNEKNLRHRHTIEEDGYNSGRDDLVAAAMQGGRFGDRLWKADVEWVGGMLPVGSDGINHGIEIDGITAVLTVQRHYTVSRPAHFLASVAQSVHSFAVKVQGTSGQIASLAFRGVRMLLPGSAQ